MGNLKFVPSVGDMYFCPCLMSIGMFNRCIWKGDSLDALWLSRGLLFKTEREAIDATFKMLDALED